MSNLLQFWQRFWLPSLEVLSDMEQAGIVIDCDYLKRKAVLALAEADELETELAVWASDYTAQTEQPINWGSHVQVKAFLYDFKCYPIPPVKGPLNATKRNSKKERVSCQSAINWLATNTSSATDQKYLRKLLQAAKTRKLAQFMEKLPAMVSPDGRLRCKIGPGADTGRLISSNPNLQQIPVRDDKFGIREAFTAAPGKLLVVADYSQLEMYVLAHFLIYELDDHSLARDLSDGDVHTNTAFNIWGDQLRALGATKENIKDKKRWKVFRDNAKTINYAVPYGKTATGLGAQILDASGRGIGKAKAQDLLDDYFEANPGLDELFEIWRNRARQTGYVHTLLGRTRPLPNACSDNQWDRWAAERRAVNTAVQGSAADIVTAALMACVGVGPTSSAKPLAHELRHAKVELLLQVHDELIFEVPAEHAEQCCAMIKEIMENPFDAPLKVQLRVDAQVGRTWGECK